MTCRVFRKARKCGQLVKCGFSPSQDVILTFFTRDDFKRLKTTIHSRFKMGSETFHWSGKWISHTVCWQEFHSSTTLSLIKSPSFFLPFLAVGCKDEREFWQTNGFRWRINSCADSEPGTLGGGTWGSRYHYQYRSVDPDGTHCRS